MIFIQKVGFKSGLKTQILEKSATYKFNVKGPPKKVNMFVTPILNEKTKFLSKKLQKTSNFYIISNPENHNQTNSSNIPKTIPKSTSSQNPSQTVRLNQPQEHFTGHQK